MSFPIIYFAGGEDVDFVGNGGGLSFDPAAGGYRSAYARCCLRCFNTPGVYYKSIKQFSASNLWVGTQSVINQNTPSANYVHWGLSDSGGVNRIMLMGSASGFAMYKVSAANVFTQLGSAFSIPYTGSLDKFDVQVNYSTTGSVDVWLNGSHPFSYSGDVTTDGQTVLSNVLFGCGVAGNSSVNTGWSEIVVSDSDTRSMSLQTLPPVVNGNTHNFDVGSPAASNVNEIIINDTTLDGATTAGLIDQYTIPALASGSFTIAAFSMSARLMRGFGGPTKADLGVRSAAADFWSPDQTLNASFTSGYQYVWNTDPATAAAWLALPANIGLKAVA